MAKHWIYLFLNEINEKIRDDVVIKSLLFMIFFYLWFAKKYLIQQFLRYS